MEQIYDGQGSLPVTTYIWQIALILLGAFILGYVLRLLLNESLKERLTTLQDEVAYLKANQQPKVQASSEVKEDNSKELKRRIQDLNDKLSKCYAERMKFETKLANTNARLNALKSDEDDAPKVFSHKTSKKPPIPNPSSPVVEESNSSDDFKKIEGIGPKIEEILKNGGLKTYKDLIDKSVVEIRTVLKEAGPTYAVHDPATWGEQAELAMNQKWTELSSLQASFKGGKRT